MSWVFRSLQTSEESIKSPGAGIIGSCVPSDTACMHEYMGMLETNSGSFEEH